MSDWRWLESTRRLQEQIYGYDFDDWLEAVEGLNDPALHPLTQYLQWNVLAAQIELAETTVEFSWKPWATDKPYVNRDRLRDELVDVLHFVGNMLVAIGVDDEELEDAYQVKQAKNRRRQLSGSYSARKGSLGEGSEAE